MTTPLLNSPSMTLITSLMRETHPSTPGLLRARIPVEREMQVDLS